MGSKLIPESVFKAADAGHIPRATAAAVVDIVCNKFDTYSNLSSGGFGSLISMMIEEWCLANNADINDFAKNLHKGLIEVNEELGKY